MRDPKKAMRNRRRRRLQALISESERISSSQRGGEKESYLNWRKKEQHSEDWEKDAYRPYFRAASAYDLDEGEGGPPIADSRVRRYVIQGLLSLLLLAGIYLVQDTSSPWGLQAKTLTEKAFVEEMNFERMAFWYESRFGNTVSFLPTFNPGNSSGVAVTLPTNEDHFLRPHGEVVRPFSEKYQGILLQVNPGDDVTAAMEGWVVFAGERQGMGQTVILQHQGGVATWYTLLGDTLVEANDWVQTGQVVGLPSRSEGQAVHYFFALQQNGEFVNPEVGIDAQ